MGDQFTYCRSFLPLYAKRPDTVGYGIVEPDLASLDELKHRLHDKQLRYRESGILRRRSGLASWRQLGVAHRLDNQRLAGATTCGRNAGRFASRDVVEHALSQLVASNRQDLSHPRHPHRSLSIRAALSRSVIASEHNHPNSCPHAALNGQPLFSLKANPPG